jgi:ribonuclease HI
MALEYVPTSWRKSKAIFIPKTGKEDYSLPRSWRPISLMSFTFKTLERLILWHLEETILTEFPFHKNQHAFRKGRSTESALSDTVDILESEVLRKGLAIGVFLDIEGAFDNLLPEGVIRSLKNRNTPQPLLNWFREYLVSRDVVVNYKGVFSTRRLVKGTPQGGVLSPILWNLAFEEVLSLVDDTAIKACGYADDLVLIGRGPDPTTIIATMQRVLTAVDRWGTQQGHRFSAGKSVAVAFTRKYKWKGPRLFLNNTPLPWQTQVKYLGVVLDDRLGWGPLFKDRTSKAIKMLFQYKQIVGREFGPHPRYMRWMYTGIIRPALAYGAVVWWRRVALATSMTTLTKINRLALLTFGPVRRSTPTVGMEMIGNLLPLDLFLQGEVAKTWLRIGHIRHEIWDGVGTSPTARGHRRALRQLTNGLSLPDIVSDEMPEVTRWTRHFEVDLDFQTGLPFQSPISCYTDGAKTKLNTGAGYCINQRNAPVARESISLGPIPSVFQAELIAILQAAEALLPLVTEGQIIIHTDSQAALRALSSPVFSSKTTFTTWMALDSLGRMSPFSVKLKWVKAHSGHAGNELADSLAKRGAAEAPPDLGQPIPVSPSYLHAIINDVTEQRWNQRWSQFTRTARQSRMFWPMIDKEKSKRLLLYSRQDYGDAVRLLTGHNNLNRHRFVTGETDNSECRLCQEDDESSEHLLCDCPALGGLRFQTLGVYLAETRLLSTMPLDGVMRFISLMRKTLIDEGLEKI